MFDPFERALISYTIFVKLPLNTGTVFNIDGLYYQRNLVLQNAIEVYDFTMINHLFERLLLQYSKDIISFTLTILKSVFTAVGHTVGCVLRCYVESARLERCVLPV